MATKASKVVTPEMLYSGNCQLQNFGDDERLCFLGSVYDLVSLCNFFESTLIGSITEKTLANYVNNGLISTGAYIAMQDNQLKHRAYHPFSIIELLTAFNLAKGNWLNPERDTRIARLTQQDIYVGRLACLEHGLASELYQASVKYKISQFCYFRFKPLLKEDHAAYFEKNVAPELDEDMDPLTFRTLYYAHKSAYNEWPYPMNYGADVHKYYVMAQNVLRNIFITEENVEKYIACNEMFYRSTFTYWYNMYIKNIIDKLPKDLPDFDCGGFSKPKAESKPEPKNQSNSNQ